MDGWVAGLCAAISAFDPGFTAAIRPAPSREITELASWLKGDVPPPYLHFLRHMGRYDSGLFYYERCDTNLLSILDYIRVNAEYGDTLQETMCLPIAIGSDIEGFGLPLKQRSAEPPVVFLEDSRAGSPAFDGLPAMAFSYAFNHELNATGRAVRIRSLHQDAQSFGQQLEQKGYARAWFSETSRFFFRRDRALIAVAASDGKPLSLSAGGMSETAMAQALADIQQLTGVLEYEMVDRDTLPRIREVWQAAHPD